MAVGYSSFARKTLQFVFETPTNFHSSKCKNKRSNEQCFLWMCRRSQFSSLRLNHILRFSKRQNIDFSQTSFLMCVRVRQSSVPISFLIRMNCFVVDEKKFSINVLYKTIPSVKTCRIFRKYFRRFFFESFHIRSWNEKFDNWSFTCRFSVITVSTVVPLALFNKSFVSCAFSKILINLRDMMSPTSRPDHGATRSD